MKLAISEEQQFYNVEQLQELGYTYYLIGKMSEQGVLEKINKSTYENTSYVGETSDFAYLNAVAPKAVVCLMSAARFYGLTTFLPDVINIAIDKGMKITTLPEWPAFHVYYFAKERYETGVITQHDGVTEFKIYDIEKTVVDIIYYRNKIGIEETKEVLRSYLMRPDRDLNKLHRYAAMLGVEPILSTYLEVLL